MPNHVISISDPRVTSTCNKVCDLSYGDSFVADEDREDREERERRKRHLRWGLRGYVPYTTCYTSGGVYQWPNVACFLSQQLWSIFCISLQIIWEDASSTVTPISGSFLIGVWPQRMGTFRNYCEGS